MKTRAEIKRAARDVLNNNIFSTEWLSAFLVVLIESVIFGAVSFTAIGTFLLIGFFGIGVARYYLDAVRGKDSPKNIVKMFSGFTDGKAVDNLVLGVLLAIYTFLWSLLFIIPGIVKSYSYSMAYYIKLDNPEMSSNDCITKSRQMMNGHKMQLFIQDLSFIGWFIVGSLCLGVGLLWVDAYFSAARAGFYQALLEEQDEAAYSVK